MWFSRPEYWSGLPFPSPGDLPGPGIEPLSPALVGKFFTTESPGKPFSHWSTREVPLGKFLMLLDGLTCQAAATVMPEGARDESSEDVSHLPA